jgi:hypothetical protein
MENKKCSKCEKILNVSDFYKDKNKLSGLSSHCKKCKNNETKIRRQNRKESNIKIPISKSCPKCEKIKPSNDFNKTKSNKDGLAIYCRKCNSNINKRRRIENKQNKHKIIADETIIKICSTCNIKKSLKYFRVNRKSNDNFSNICIECLPTNKWTVEKQRISEKKYRMNNPEKMKEKYKKQGKNINRRIRDSLNHRISGALFSKNTRKNNKTFYYLGCDIFFFKKWLIYLFQDKMTFENYGTWHLDHVKPCASYDLSNEKEILECFNWKNIQPLWGSDNLEKNNKIDTKLIEEHKEKVKKFIIISAEYKDGELLEQPQSLKHYNVTGNGERECLKSF